MRLSVLQLAREWRCSILIGNLSGPANLPGVCCALGCTAPLCSILDRIRQEF